VAGVERANRIQESGTNHVFFSIVKQEFAQGSVLDCSLRDGGYLNSWRFPLSLIRSHVELSSALKIPYIEVGLKTVEASVGSPSGLTANCSARLIADLRRFSGESKLGIMLNQADIGSLKQVESLFDFSIEASIPSFIRIATDIENIEDACSTATLLIEQGFEVFINLMKLSTLSNEDLKRAAASAGSLGLTGIYLADSIGAVDPKFIATAVDIVAQESNAPVGIHCHDNLGLALANTISGLDAGAKFVDATVRGIGRGAGNTALEELLLVQSHETVTNPKFRSLLRTWDDYLKAEGNVETWGKSADYGLAARLGVHPTYVQELRRSSEFSEFERLKIIERVAEKKSSRYSRENLSVGEEWFASTGVTSPEILDVFEGKSVLLIGGGTSVDQITAELREITEAEEMIPVIVGARKALLGIEEFRVLCNPISFMSGAALESDGLRLIGPLAQVPGKLISPKSQETGISIETRLDINRFGFDGQRLSIPNPRSSVFALALISSLSPREVVMAGFEGFPRGDSRNAEFSDAVGRALSSGIIVTGFGEVGFGLPSRGF